MNATVSLLFTRKCCTVEVSTSHRFTIVGWEFKYVSLKKTFTN